MKREDLNDGEKFDLRQGMTCAALERGILEEFTDVVSVSVRDNVQRLDDRLILVSAVMRGRPAGTVPSVLIDRYVAGLVTTHFLNAPKLPNLRIFVSVLFLDSMETEWCPRTPT